MKRTEKLKSNRIGLPARLLETLKLALGDTQAIRPLQVSFGLNTSGNPWTTDMGSAGMSAIEKYELMEWQRSSGRVAGFLLIASAAWLLLCGVTLAACAVSISSKAVQVV